MVFWVICMVWGFESEMVLLCTRKVQWDILSSNYLITMVVLYPNRYTCIDIEMIDIAVSFIVIKIRNDYTRTSMSYDVKLSLYDYATGTPLRGYTDKRRAFVSAAEILMRIYQNPIHLNGARWRTTF